MMADGLIKALLAAKWPAFLDQIGLKDAQDLKTEEPTILDGRLQDRLDFLELLELDGLTSPILTPGYESEGVCQTGLSILQARDRCDAYTEETRIPKTNRTL
jgi:hypothetical protein